MFIERFNIHNRDWVKQVNNFVVFEDERLGELTIVGKLVYADDTTAVVKNSDVVIVSRTGYFSKRALEVYKELKEQVGEEEELGQEFEEETISIEEEVEDEEETLVPDDLEYDEFVEDHPPAELFSE